MKMNDQDYFLLMRLVTVQYNRTGGCENTTSEDPEATAVASKVITASFAMLFYVTVLVLSTLGAFYSWWSKLLSMPVTYVLFLVGVLVVPMNTLNNESDQRIPMCYRIASGSLVGIIYAIVGGIAFFQKPPSCTAACRPVANRPCVQHRYENMQTLGRQHPSMGLVVGVITLSLVSFEALLIAGSQRARKPEQSGWWLYLTSVIIYLMQKIIQVVMYEFLRYRIPSDGFKGCASFYFKVLSFFNFVMWFNDIVNLDYDYYIYKLSGKDDRNTYGAAYMMSVYKALLIDYRLLCSLLFLEHALEIQEDKDTETRTGTGTESNAETQGNPLVDDSFDSVQYVTINDLTSSDRQKRNMGYLVGLTCLLVQLVSLANYLPDLHVGSWVRVLAILVYTFLVVCGVVLLSKNNLEVQQKSDKESSGIKLMVCCMGAVGFSCWIIQAALAAFWATIGSRGDVTDDAHFGWAAANLSVRAIGTLFLVTVFAKVNVIVIAKRNPTVKSNHFLVPVMMLGILSEFVGTVIYEHAGPVTKQISCQVKESKLLLLFKAGPAIYLGFCIHLFLNFLVIQCQMGKTRVALNNGHNQATETSPLLGFLRGRTRTRKVNRTV